MKVSWRILGLVAVAALAACEPGEVDLGGGGGGGTGGGAFSKGFAFVRNDTTGRNLYVVDDAGDANSPLRLTQTGGAYEPAVSPTGKLVAFAYRPPGTTTSEIRTVPTTGQGQASTIISNTSTGCSGCSKFRNPTFSPDGNTLVFTLDKNGFSQLARIDTAGTSALQILTTSSSAIANYYGVASFYPNGQTVLATASNSGPSQADLLVQVNVTTGAAQLVTNYLGGSAVAITTRAVVSPDGAKVAFDGRVSSGGSQVFVASLSPSFGSVTAISSHTGSGVQDTWPSWRGSTEVGFLSDDGGNDNIYKLSIASKGPGTLLVPGALEPGYGGK